MTAENQPRVRNFGYVIDSDPISGMGTSLGIRLPWPVSIYLLAVIIPLGFHLGPLAMTALRLFLLMAVIPLLAQLLMGRFGRIILADISFIGFTLLLGLSIMVNNPDRAIEHFGSVGMEFMGGYLVGRAYIRSAESFLALCRWLGFAVLLLTPFALYEAKTGQPPIIEAIRALPGISSVGIVYYDKRLGLERVQAVFAHPIHYGLFCSVIFSLIFVAMKDSMSDYRRYALSAIVAMNGFLALSSGALLAIFLQFSLIAWYSMFRRVRQRWWILVGIFCLAYLAIELLSSRSALKVFMTYATFSADTAYWRSFIFEYGMQNIWANPLVGIGLQDWARPDWMQHISSVDNFWLLIAMSYGIPAFLALAIGYATVIIGVMWRSFSDDSRLALIRRAWVFTFLGLSFTLVTVHVWTNIFSFTFFMFGTGVWLLDAQPQPNKGVMTTRHNSRSPTDVRRQALEKPSVKKPFSPAEAPRFTRFPPPARRDSDH